MKELTPEQLRKEAKAGEPLEATDDRMASLDAYYQGLCRDQITHWLHCIQAPSEVALLGTTLLGLEDRHHGRRGVRWTAMLTGGLSMRGWLALDGQGFDVDERPDA